MFNKHSIEADKVGAASGSTEPYIPITKFKDQFLPALGWKSDAEKGYDGKDGKSGASGARTDSASRTESMAIDQILDGKRQSDLAKEKQDKDRLKDKNKEKLKADKLEEVPEAANDYDQDSRVSPLPSEVVGAGAGEPRMKLNRREGGKRSGKDDLTAEALRDLEA